MSCRGGTRGIKGLEKHQRRRWTKYSVLLPIYVDTGEGEDDGLLRFKILWQLQKLPTTYESTVLRFA